jgi:aryl-alcohol dehydrogenase-like predicted oxidoreductase
VARRKGVPTACLALAWVLAPADEIMPIPGTRSTAHVDDNLAAVEVELSADDVAPLDVAAPPGAAAGERYPPTSWLGWIGEMRGRRSRWML